MRAPLFLAIAIAAAAAVVAPAWAESAILRTEVVARGQEITLGDLFENAGKAAATPVAPAPRPGTSARLSGALVAAAAAEAGLAYAPEAESEAVIVRGPRVPARTAAAAALMDGYSGSGGSRELGPAQVRRGDIVTLVYAVPGLTVSTRVRAMGDGASGQTVRFTNLQSNRVIEARVTGPGQAAAAPAP